MSDVVVRPGADDPAAGQAPPGRPRCLLIAVAFFAFVSLGLPDAVLGVAWPSIRHELDVSIDRLGWLLGSAMVGYLISTVLSGTVVRRLGVGRVLVWSTVLVVASLAGYATAPSWTAFVALGVLAGLGAGAIDAGINSYAAARFSPGTVSWLHASYGVGATSGPLAMTAVLAQGGSWRTGYGLLAAALVVMGVVFLLTSRLWQDGAAPAAGERARTSLADALRRPMVWLHVACFFLYSGVEVASGQWLFSVLNESRGLGVGFAGTCVGLLWGGLTCGRLAFGWLAERIAPVTIVRAALVLAPACLVLLSVAPRPAVTAAGCLALGLALAPVFPMLISLTPSRVGPAVAAHAVGLQVAAAYVGAAAVPTLAGLAARRDLELVCPFIAACGLPLLLLHEVAARRGRAFPDRRGMA